MAIVNSKTEARRAVRKAQAEAVAARTKRERENIDDVAALMMAQGRLSAVDDWESDRIDQVRAEAQRRREAQRVKAAGAVGRLRDRGESLQSIAALAGTTVSEVRALGVAVSRALGTEAADATANG